VDFYACHKTSRRPPEAPRFQQAPRLPEKGSRRLPEGSLKAPPSEGFPEGFLEAQAGVKGFYS